MLTNLSLYEFIKQQRKSKGRKLKIVADWDEVIKPLKPLAIYDISGKKGDFKEFFKRFWEIAVFSYKNLNSEGKIVGVNGTNEEKEAFDKYLEALKGRRGRVEDYWKSYYSSPEWVERITNAPFLSISEDLLKALKEDLIEHLIIISSYRKGRGKGQGVTRKTSNFPKSFGVFPQCKLELTETDKNEEGKYIPYRWEVLRDKWPDFDILIDDNNNVILQAKENLPDSKIYVMPNYKGARDVQGSNIYCVETTVSDIKSEDFSIAVLEIENKKLKESLRELNNKQIKQERDFWIIGSVVVILPLIFLLIIKSKKKKNS